MIEEQTLFKAMHNTGRERANCVDVAMRRRHADLVIRGGDLLSVRSGEILPGWGVATSGRRIAAIGDIEDCIGPQTIVIEANGMILLPGFCDGHLHIESSCLSPAGYAQAALPGGTTSVMEDPHEIANVIGLDGIRYFVEQSEDLPLKVWTQVPSSVPPSKLETSGGDIGPLEVLETLSQEGIVGIGEVMVPEQVAANDPRIRGIIDAGLVHHHPVEGHAIGIQGSELDAYSAAGIGSDHEANEKDFLDKLRRGMSIQLRVGRWWSRRLRAMIYIILEKGLDTRSLMVVTDDRQTGDLLELGCMDYNVRSVIEAGIDPIQAVQMATINVANHFGLSHEIGEIAPGRLADVLLVEDLRSMAISATIANGQMVARGGNLLIDLSISSVPAYTRNTVNLPRPLTAEDFEIHAPDGVNDNVGVRLPSYCRPADDITLKVVHGVVQPDLAADVTKLAVIDRHSGKGQIGIGFVRGFGLTQGAVAMTINHDAHNLLVIGGRSKDMAFVANRVADLDGGIVVGKEGQVLAELQLPIAGLMSPLSVRDVAEGLSKVDGAARTLGASEWLGPAPTMILSFMTLTAAHDRLITDKGLVDVKASMPISIFT